MDRVDSGSIVDIIFLDFSKAFDVVNHSVILTKLQMLGIGGKIPLWVGDFLVGHTADVRVGGKASVPKPFTSNVPQGSPV